MMIRVERLGKKYFLGHRGEGRERYTALRDVIARNAKGLWRKTRDALHGRALLGGDKLEEFWALKDVSFDVEEGEVVGIIGRNGAGKSTLLKVMSRITEPTEGRVILGGRVASLLEVGTGFHPELTGRENIFLNGAILGMTRADIRKRFDTIVAFSEVEKFLDTPVKRYSSGMYVRLAFSVAAHLEPEILVVDEVLAVGDAQFQEKCLGKMTEVASKGRTVLFVSHNMQAVRHLCTRAIVMKDGTKWAEGPTEECVQSYINKSAHAGPCSMRGIISALPRDEAFRLSAVRVIQGSVESPNLVSGKAIEIEIEFEALQSTKGLHVYVMVYDLEGSLIFESLHNGHIGTFPVVPRGMYKAVCTIPPNFLAGRAYELVINAAIHNARHCIPQPSPVRMRINVVPMGEVNRAYPGYLTPGKIAPLLGWQTNEIRLTTAKQ